MSQPKYSFLSSSVVKEIARYRGNIKDMVAPGIAKAIEEKLGKK